MPTSTRTLSGFFENIYREVVDLSMRVQPDEHPMVMRVLTSDRNFERFKTYAGLGRPQVKPELSPIQFDDPIEGPHREVEHQTTAIGFKISYEAMEDDKFGIGSQTAGSLGDSLREGYEEDFAALWNNCLATDGNPVLTYDGVSIANDAHVPLGQGVATQDNLFTGDVSLSLLQSFRYHFRNLVNDRGLRNQGHRLATVIIAPDATTEPLLDQMIGGTGMQPFTADNTVHELAELRTQIKKVVYSYMTDTDRTIGLSQMALTKEGGPAAIWRRRPSMTSWDDDAIQGSCFAGSYRNSSVCPDWHGIAVSGG